MDLSCPFCHSENTRRVPLIYRDGLTMVESRTAGLGVGMARGGMGVGVASARTRGTQQSLTSLGLSPPEERATGWLMFGVVAVPLLLAFMVAVLMKVNSGLPHWVGTLTAAVLAVASALVMLRKAQEALAWNREEFPCQMEEWDGSYRCERCGEVFLPDED